MRKRNLLFLLPLLFLLSCVRESPLSDVVLDNPALIAPSLQLSSEKDMNGNVTQKIEAWLYDRNVNSFELKGGNLKLNGNPMSLKRADSPVEENGVPYYDCSAIKSISYGQEYKLDVALSNGASHSVSVKAPSAPLNLQTPDSFDPTQGFTINWNPGLGLEKMTLNMKRHMDTGQSEMLFSISIPEASLSQGNYKIGSDKIMEDSDDLEGNITKLDLTLTGVHTSSAKADPAFHENAGAEVNLVESAAVATSLQ